MRTTADSAYNAGCTLRHPLRQADIVDVDPAGAAGLGALAFADANHHLLDRRHVHAHRPHIRVKAKVYETADEPR